MLNVTILDGYVDEPTCLGVPPYISPYPRYVAGAIWFNEKNAKINYITIDQIRNDNTSLKFINKSDLVVVIAGMIVPGKYLAGYPASPNELISYLYDIKKPIKVLGGPAARYGFGISGGKKIIDSQVVKDTFDLIITGDVEVVVSKLLENNLSYENTDRSLFQEKSDRIKNFAILGSNIVKQHPNFPDYLITEIETYRGCPRSIVGGCSFCSESLKGLPSYRKIEDVVNEVQSLYSLGIRHVRVGNQPCIFSYMAKKIGKKEFPVPNPDELDKLFTGIRKVAPDLKTLHIDNANPGVIAHYPEECKEIAKIIVKNHTSGDVAAFGLESADPEVIRQNNLKASQEDVIFAIKLLNDVGSARGNNGLPELLPGLNFVFGLKGETKKTFKINLDFLKKIYDSNLLVRRINLRQVIPIPGTEMFKFGIKNIIKNKSEFQRFKRIFQMKIEQPMLKKIIPDGIILKGVLTEKYKGKITFGRQLGSYPILVGIPGIYPLFSFFDVKVVGYGYRSITAVPYPLKINKTSLETLSTIPGIGKKRALRIIRNRPFRNKEEIISSLDEPKIGKKLLEYINF